MNRNTEDRLARVRRRIEQAVPYSPDWAAAMDELEELEGTLASEPVATLVRPEPPHTLHVEMPPAA